MIEINGIIYNLEIAGYLAPDMITVSGIAEEIERLSKDLMDHKT